MGSTCFQLRALLVKSLLILKRNKCSTIAELIFPIFLMLILVLVRQAFQVEDKLFLDEEKSDDNFFTNHSSYYVDSSRISAVDNVDKSWTNETIEGYKSMLQQSPSLATYIKELIINKMNEENFNTIDSIKVRGLLETCNSGENIRVVGLIGNKKDKLLEKLNTYINVSPFDKAILEGTGTKDNLLYKNYSTVAEMEDYAGSDDYGRTSDFPMFCVAIQLNYDSGSNKYQMSLHYTDLRIGGKKPDVPSGMNKVFDEFQQGPDEASFDCYQNNGYNYLLKIMYEIILEEQLTDAKMEFAMGRMKYEDYKYDIFSMFVSYIIPTFTMIAYMSPLCLNVYRMVYEKETRAKEGMKIMGMGEGIYFLSHFIMAFCFNIIHSIGNAIIIHIMFEHIPLIYLIGTFWMLGMNIFAMAFFFQSFIDKTRVALILSILIYFVSCFLYIAIYDEKVAMGFKILCSVFPMVAFEIGIIILGTFQSALRDFTSDDLNKTYFNYKINYMFLMFFIDFFIYLFLGYYLQNIISHDFGIKRPWYFICTRTYWCGNQKNNSKVIESINKDEQKRLNSENPDDFQSEELYKNKNKDGDLLKLHNIVKIFGDNKKAVDNVSLNFYKDEIFALLGHNGAGKSTLISMLSGLYEATSGEAYYNGKNVLDDAEMDIFRQEVGICPQHDVLFGDLSLKEHLQMFCHFKGVPSDKIDDEIKKTVQDFRIADIQDILAKNLSAGQRRKLSIAISIIGGSKVIFLDEPSSGMDITSRRNLWEILKRITDNKIIILTTHYMEEASVLGKRIGIISDGRMKCIGTPLFLIERFGKFMSINIVKEEDADNDKIIEFFKEHSPHVEYEKLSEEIMFRIPKRDYKNIPDEKNEKLNLSENANDNANKNTNFSFESFFESLDSNLKELKIKTYSAAMPTLEDVFLNVASSEIGKEAEKEMKEQQVNNDKILFEENFFGNYSPAQKFWIDLSISLKKRLFQVLRDMRTFVLEILCPIILVLIGLCVSQVNFIDDSDPIYPSIKEYLSDTNVYYTYHSKADPFINISAFLANDDDGVIKYKDLSSQMTSYRSSSLGEAGKQFMLKVYEQKDTNSYSSILIKDEEKDGVKTLRYMVLLNAEMKEANSVFVPMFSNQLVSNFIKKQANKTVTINYYHKGLPLMAEVVDKIKQGTSNMLSMFSSIAFSLIPANFVTLIVKEKVNNSKHLMKVSGITIVSYWLSNYIFEIIKYYFEGGIIMIMIILFNYMPRYFYLVYLLYGPAMVSFTYMVSFIFETESGSQNGLILINLLFGSLATTVCLALRQVDSLTNIGKGLAYPFRLIPSFCLGHSFSMLLSATQYLYTETPIEDYLKIKPIHILKPKFIGADLLFMAAEAILCLVVLAIIEKCSYSMSIPPREKITANTEINDSMVNKEIDKAQSKLLLKENNRNNVTDIAESSEELINDYAVRVQNISKTYNKPGKCCDNEKVLAVKNINFCVEYGECFGMLGINGAGKTTMFKCITQETAQTNGAIFINGIDTSTDFEKVHDKFGYCPQFDAIFEYLTTYENLEFFAKIKGVSSDKLERMIKAMMNEMSLTQYSSKIAGQLSGGNKRKLSVAISMICNPPIVLLDEPSTGMDPEARRFMWAVIHKISNRKKKSSVIMTTHSMDEAETLCRRMGIMVNGEFVCLGSAQYIKDKYGYGFEIDIRIMPYPENEFEELIKNAGLSKDLIVSQDNVLDILQKLGREKYYNELNEQRIGRKVLREMIQTQNMNIFVLCAWIYYVNYTMKIIKEVKQYFDEIILTEFIENNFLFKIKKTPESKSIGFLFGLIEKVKDNCNITEYSIQPTSLEQIFNMFAAGQGRSEEEKGEKEDNFNEKVEIPITDELLGDLIFQ